VGHRPLELDCTGSIESFFNHVRLALGFFEEFANPHDRYHGYQQERTGLGRQTDSNSRDHFGKEIWSRFGNYISSYPGRRSN